VRPVHLFWLCWFLASFGVFLAAETWGLVTGKGRTLSEAIWALEKFRTGQPLYQWSAGHLLFGGVFLLVAAWLVGHFVLGWWR
jgi:hypothetical protein